MKYPKSELFEKLASIEHEKWSQWQSSCHRAFMYGEFEEFMTGWSRQIITPYSELSEEEKDSKRAQVMRYWNLISDDKKGIDKNLNDIIYETSDAKDGEPIGIKHIVQAISRSRYSGFDNQFLLAMNDVKNCGWNIDVDSLEEQPLEVRQFLTNLLVNSAVG